MGERLLREYCLIFVAASIVMMIVGIFTKVDWPDTLGTFLVIGVGYLSAWIALRKDCSC